MNTDALKEFLFKNADDLLIMGHRNSEWTGIGPLLEEDIAFASMAQDKVGQSRVLYEMLHQLGEAEPDTLGFLRPAEQFHCAQLVELPVNGYDFTLVRHFLFDEAQYLRFQMLTESSYTPLANFAKKIIGELRYHVMHAEAWIKQLGNSDWETISRMQGCVNELWPYALGLFEKSPFEEILIKESVFQGEVKLKQLWLDRILGILEKTQIFRPEDTKSISGFGGRAGQHTPYLSVLLDEMIEVIKLDPTTEW